MKVNQQKRVLEYIEKHRSITRMEAYERLGITELPKRISELRRSGYNIADQWVDVKNRYGEKTRVKQYFKAVGNR